MGGPLTCLGNCPPAGEPKAIPWTHLTPLRCAANAFFHQDVRQGDVVCWPTNMGWMLGPWLVFAGMPGAACFDAVGTVWLGRLGSCKHAPEKAPDVPAIPATLPCSAAERRHDSPAARQPAGPPVWPVCAGGWRDDARSGALHCQGEGMAEVQGGNSIGLPPAHTVGASCLQLNADPLCLAQGWRATGCMSGLDWGCIRCFRFVCPARPGGLHAGLAAMCITLRLPPAACPRQHSCRPTCCVVLLGRPLPPMMCCGSWHAWATNLSLIRAEVRQGHI